MFASLVIFQRMMWDFVLRWGLRVWVGGLRLRMGMGTGTGPFGYWHDRHSFLLFCFIIGM
jgi:hypothetical protein